VWQTVFGWIKLEVRPIGAAGMQVSARNQIAGSVVSIASDADLAPISVGMIVTTSVTQEAISGGSLAFVGGAVSIVKTSDLLNDK